MSVTRITCTDCGLPYYEDQGDCPYCQSAEGAREGATAAGETTAPEPAGEEATDPAPVSDEAGDTATDDAAGSDGSPAAAGRSRETCPECGLPYYADGGDCPYCERAGASGGGTTAEAGDGDAAEAGTSTARPAPEATTDRPADERNDRGGLLARVKRLFMG